MKYIPLVVLLIALPLAVAAGPGATSNKIVVRNSTSEAVTLSLTTSAGSQIYSPVKLNPGDRYELNDTKTGVVVRVTSTRCGTLTTELGAHIDWTVEVKSTGPGCELVKSFKSPK